MAVINWKGDVIASEGFDFTPKGSTTLKSNALLYAAVTYVITDGAGGRREGGLGSGMAKGSCSRKRLGRRSGPDSVGHRAPSP